MGKKFLGLGGTDHFWDRAKAWILNQITSAVAAKIAEVVANAPEDLDTLKEIADWISTHADDAAAMNTQITENKNNIATNTSDISALKTSVAGKADKLHTHSAGDIASGTLPIANGGTGATTALGAFESLANGLPEGAGPLDTEHIIFQNENRKNWGLYTLSQFWEYIKGKISSVLGLTKDNYGGKASTAGTADKVKDENNVVQYKATSFNGFKMQDTQEKALYVEGCELANGDSGGIAITNDCVTAFGAGDTDGVFRVINEDNVPAGPVFKVMKDGQVYTTNTIHGSIDGNAYKIRTSTPSSLTDGDIWIS